MYVLERGDSDYLLFHSLLECGLMNAIQAEPSRLENMLRETVSYGIFLSHFSTRSGRCPTCRIRYMRIA